MKFCKFRSLVLTTLVIALIPNSVSGAIRFFQSDIPKQDTAAYVSPFAEDNDKCFKCHGQAKYVYTNESLGKEIKALMCSERIVKKEDFYRSNHKSFGCTDCHSSEYFNFPHSGELRMEQKLACLDCHGGDETYAKYQFEAIDTAYRASTHFKLEEEGYSCWKCHDPHTYKVNVRNSVNLKEVIRYDNAICLKCHSDFTQFQLLTEKEEMSVLKTHSWLPNQTSHFSSVRCIECHTRVDNNILISHQIMPKEQAVRLCNECHSQNSILMASLYKFQSKEMRRDGFLNGIILNESYVIGANRNAYLNGLSLIIFFGILVVICIHVFFRLKKSSKTNKEE